MCICVCLNAQILFLKGINEALQQVVFSFHCLTVLGFITRDAPRGHTVSKNGSISFFFFFFSSSYSQIGTLIYSLNSPLSYSGCIVLIVFNNSRPIKIHSCPLYREGGDQLTLTCVTSKHHLIS